MPVFTIRTQASDITDLESEYPYMYWIAEEQLLVVSKKQLYGRTIESGNGVLIRNIENNTWIQTETFDYYVLEISDYKLGDCYRLYYNDVTGWEARQPDEVKKELTTTTIYTAAYGSSTLSKSIYTNGIALPSPWDSAGSTLPSGLPPLDSVDDAINAALNNTTWVSSEANEMIDNLQKQQEKYENGQLSKENFTLLLEVYNQTFIDMADSAGNTLADQIAINNGLTAVQTAQDKMLSQDTIDKINEFLEEYKKEHDFVGFTEADPEALMQQLTEVVVGSYFQYSEGLISKDEALAMIMELQMSAVGIQSMEMCSEADKQLAEGILSLCNQWQNNINNAGDVEPDISWGAESSDKEEIELLNDMISVMQDHETDSITNNQQVRQGLNEVSDFIEPLWINPFVRDMIIAFVILVPLCAILDMRYRHL